MTLMLRNADFHGFFQIREYPRSFRISVISVPLISKKEHSWIIQAKNVSLGNE
jgi:hypothetical protein